MTIIKAFGQHIDEGCNAVRLARYAQLAGFSECAFWGVYNEADPVNEACRPIQTLFERQSIAKYLGEAQEEIEQVAGYPLAPCWFEDEVPYNCRVRARWQKVIEMGVKGVIDIALGAVVDHTNDPAVIGPIATTVTDIDEVHIFHPGTDIEIDPSDITIAGGLVTIEIPRCRLVIDPNNPDGGWDYTDVGMCGASVPVPGVFECTVDVKRVYNDETTNALLVYPHRSGTTCASNCCCPTCSEYTYPACGYIYNAAGGLIDVLKASVVGSVWTASCSSCDCLAPEKVRLYYRAGMTPLTAQAEDAIIRLAHAKMPKPPCGCGPLMEMWTRDRFVPDVLDRERLNCPFGLSDGAWIAWKFANALAARRVVSM